MGHVVVLELSIDEVSVIVSGSEIADRPGIY